LGSTALRMIDAVRAAQAVAADFGVVSSDPLVLQETNNTVLWLRPEPVVAKVAVRVDAQVDNRLEFAVASELAALGAEIARPMLGTRPATHHDTGCVVTLWERLEGLDRTDVPPAELAGSLRRLHAALARTDVELPSFRAMLTQARQALENDTFMARLIGADRELLRDTFGRGVAALEGLHYGERRLHGEPHAGNRITTSEGLRFIDLASCCVGPLEWDLAFQPPEVVDLFPESDGDLLAVLRRLNSARVATWCMGSRHTEMQQHGELHLALLRQTSEDEWHVLDIP
jgi:Phosphotransferase enzyme family